MRIERISGAILILLSGALCKKPLLRRTPLTLPIGLVALFTEIPERGKRTKRDYRA